MKHPSWVNANLRAAKAEGQRRRKAEEQQAEADRYLNRFCQNPTMFNAARHTCSRAVGKLLIEHGLTFACGKAYWAKIKSLGCGVYHIFYEEKH